MRIRELREAAGLSQEKLAGLLGYKYQSTIAMIESGERKLPIDKLPRIAEVLGCEIADLFGKKETSAEVSDTCGNSET